MLPILNIAPIISSPIISNKVLDKIYLTPLIPLSFEGEGEEL
jgi:hypothetical protein